MNEQIHKLFGQALDEAVPETWTTLDADQLSRLKEKFAELIVRDCSLTAGLMEHEGRPGIGAQILDNFGVES